MKSIVLALILCSVTGSVNAKCKMPESPVLPDAEIAVIAQMVKAKKDVTKYMGLANKFLKCTRNDAKHDTVVDKMRALAKDYNDLAKAYKKRVKS